MLGTHHNAKRDDFIQEQPLTVLTIAKPVEKHSERASCFAQNMGRNFTYLASLKSFHTLLAKCEHLPALPKRLFLHSYCTSITPDRIILQEGAWLTTASSSSHRGH